MINEFIWRRWLAKPRIKGHSATLFRNANIALYQANSLGKVFKGILGRANVAIENGSRDCKRAHGIGDIHDATDPSLAWAARE